MLGYAIMSLSVSEPETTDLCRVISPILALGDCFMHPLVLLHYL